MNSRCVVTDIQEALGREGGGDMPWYSGLRVDRHAETPEQCGECLPNSRSVQGVLGRTGLALILFLLRTK